MREWFRSIDDVWSIAREMSPPYCEPEGIRPAPDWWVRQFKVYRMIGYQEVSYSRPIYGELEKSTNFCCDKIKITFAKGEASEREHYSLNKEVLFLESDSFFPNIELLKSPEYDNNTDPRNTRSVPGNSDRSIRLASLKSEEVIKNAFSYIKVIEPEWYAEHGEKLLSDLSMLNRPTVKAFRKLLSPPEKTYDFSGDCETEPETNSDIHARLNKAIDFMKKISEIYSTEKDSLKLLFSRLEREINDSRDEIPARLANSLNDSFFRLKTKVFVPEPDLKPKHQEKKTEEKAVQTTFVPGYQGGGAHDELLKKVEHLQEELNKTVTSHQEERIKNRDRMWF